MKVVLAEKPSVGRDIANYLGARSRQDGYFEGNGWAVTWVFGHLVELQAPEDYNPAWKKWALETLPMIPERFQLRKRSEGDGAKQLSVVQRLLRASSEIVCATDAGREGELIFRYVLEYAGCLNKPFRRLWVSSLTHAALQQGFQKLRPGSDFDPLYAAARCRSEADWIVGLNATRFMTVAQGGGTLWSLGRVQTPILAMIVKRDLEIEHFKPEDFWELHTTYREANFKHVSGRFDQSEKADAILAKVKGQPFTITDIKEKQEKVYQPLLYDLTSLQKDMNKRSGMTANRVLQAAQKLYESKHITYPRTDSRHLSSDMKPQLPGILTALSKIKPNEVGALDLGNLAITRRIIDDSKVTDHHAIIPTTVVASNLSGDLAAVYEAVVTRFLAVFYPMGLKGITDVTGVSNQETFKTKGTVILEAGWMELYPWMLKKGNGNAKKPGRDGKEGNAAAVSVLPAFQVGESGPHDPEVKKMQTSPPKHFNEATLLHLMETAGRIVDEEELREVLKGKGIGTPATRASIIETLLQRQYIRRERKNLLSNPSGRLLISLVRDERLKSPELTGDWECRLREMEKNAYPADQFMQEVEEYTRSLLNGKPETGQESEGVFGKCPKCDAAVIKGQRGYGCSEWKKGCSFVLFPDTHGASLNASQIRELLAYGSLFEPVMAEVDGKPQKVHFLMNPEGEVRCEKVAEKEYNGKTFRKAAKKALGKRGPRKQAFKSNDDLGSDMPTKAEDISLGKCPLCQGDVKESPKAFGCSEWKGGCKFTIWKTICGKRITRATTQRLLKDGSSGILKGFKSKAGKKFEASLVLMNGKVELEFVSNPENTRLS